MVAEESEDIAVATQHGKRRIVRMYDIAIIGAGPAGATLARMIGNSYRVLLVDRRDLTQPSDKSSFTKCCGGLLAPDAQEMLSTMGLGLPKKVLVCPQLFVVRVIDLQHDLERYYQRHYINLDREEFDRWLVSLIPGNVDTRFGCLFKSYESTDDGFTIRLSQNNRTYVERARILIGADGASSRIRKQLIPHDMSPRNYFAIQEQLESPVTLPFFSAIFDHEITDFCAWTIPKDGSLIVGATLLPNDEVSARFELFKRKLREKGYEFGKTIRREGAFLFRPMRTGGICTGRNGVALVGEAAGWISPSSAEGISYAFKSALAVASALEQGPENLVRRYKRRTRGLARNILLKSAKSYTICHPSIRRIILRSGIQSVEIPKNHEVKTVGHEAVQELHRRPVTEVEHS